MKYLAKEHVSQLAVAAVATWGAPRKNHFPLSLAVSVVKQWDRTTHTRRGTLWCHAVKFNKVNIVQTVAPLMNGICRFRFMINFCTASIFTWQTEAVSEITLQLHNLGLSRSISQSKHERTHHQRESRSGKLILATWVSAKTHCDASGWV